jgi:methylated-DNA-protein-cysteine methyltransferase-like protein
MRISLDGRTVLARKPINGVKKTTQATTQETKQGRASAERRARIVNLIRNLPSGKVASYGAIARAAGWPGAARQVVRILRQVQGLPWQRVVGSGGAIKLPGENGAEQRFRLRMEGVTFRGARVDMKQHEFKFSRGRGGDNRGKKPGKKRSA